MYAEDAGKYAANKFAASHVCNSICRALSLTALQVDVDLLRPLDDVEELQTSELD